MMKKTLCKPSSRGGIEIPPHELQKKNTFLLSTYWKGMDGYGYRPYILEYEEKKNRLMYFAKIIHTDITKELNIIKAKVHALKTILQDMQQYWLRSMKKIPCYPTIRNGVYIPPLIEESSQSVLYQIIGEATEAKLATDVMCLNIKIGNMQKAIGITTRYDAGIGSHSDKTYILEYEE